MSILYRFPRISSRAWHLRQWWRRLRKPPAWIMLLALLLPFLAGACSTAPRVEQMRCAVQYTGRLDDNRPVMGLACIPEPGRS